MTFRWRTAYKYYDCADAYQWAHAGRILPGDRYLYVTAFPSDVLDRIQNLRYCGDCALAQGAPPDPQGRLGCAHERVARKFSGALVCQECWTVVGHVGGQIAVTMNKEEDDG